MLKRIQIFVAGAGAIAMGVLILLRDRIGAFQDASGDAPLDEIAYGMIAVGGLFLLMLFTTFGKRLALFVMFGAIAGACFYYVSTRPIGDWAWPEYGVGVLGLFVSIGAIGAVFGAFDLASKPGRKSNPAKELAGSATQEGIKDWLEE